MLSISSLLSNLLSRQRVNAPAETAVSAPAVTVDPEQQLAELLAWHKARRDHYRALVVATGGNDYKIYSRWQHSRIAAIKIEKQLGDKPTITQLSLF